MIIKLTDLNNDTFMILQIIPKSVNSVMNQTL